jgi:hypothetical protein
MTAERREGFTKNYLATQAVPSKAEAWTQLKGESLLIDFDVLSGITSGRMLPTKRVQRTSDFRNAPCDQSLPKVRDRNPSRRA